MELVDFLKLMSTLEINFPAKSKCSPPLWGRAQKLLGRAKILRFDVLSPIMGESKDDFPRFEIQMLSPIMGESLGRALSPTFELGESALPHTESGLVHPYVSVRDNNCYEIRSFDILVIGIRIAFVI